jgi:hypothetical protein
VTEGEPAPQIGLADLARAAHRLGARGSRLADVAELLGLRPVARAAPPVTVHAPPEPAAPRPRGAAAPAPAAGAFQPGAPEEAAIGMTAVRLPDAARELPADARSLAEMLGPDRPAPPSAPEPLFRPATRRAMLRAVGARLVAAGEIDVDAVVERLAARAALDRIPRRARSTTGGGLHLLLDTGDAMDPYWLDVERFPKELIAVVGPDGVELRWFEDCPLVEPGVLLPERLEPERYAVPPPGTRILAVTAFGSRGGFPAALDVVGGWRRLAGEAARAGIPLVALTPLAPRQLPALGRHLRIVTWDRTTDVRTVAHAVAEAGWARERALGA